jgi:hypothetical protein
MKESEKLASKLLEEKLQDLGTSIPQYKHLVISLMIKFAREMCEQQKQSCLQNTKKEYLGLINEIIKNSILDSKNVCDL